MLDISEFTWRHWCMLVPLLLPNHILMFSKEELKYQNYIDCNHSNRKYMPQAGEIPSTFHILSTTNCAEFIHGNFKTLK